MRGPGQVAHAMGQRGRLGLVTPKHSHCVDLDTPLSFSHLMSLSLKEDNGLSCLHLRSMWG